MSTSLRRVVLDTNVVLSALVFPNGHLAVIREAWWAERFIPLVSHETVQVDRRLHDVPPCRDVFDVPFLELAIEGRADFLVSGDRDLLTLRGRISAFEIVHPSELMERI